MAYVPSALRVGGYTIDTNKASMPVRHPSGVASLAPRDEHRLYAGLTRHQATKWAAEVEWERLTGGDREAGLHGRGDRG